MSSYPQKFLKKLEKKFSKKIFFSILKGIIGTVHLDVRITVRVRSFLWILCGVWTKPQQQLLSAHCCGTVTA